MKLLCPACGSDDVIVYEKTAFKVNTLEHYCHSVKAHDDDAECRCLESRTCGWSGRRDELTKTEN